MPSIKELLHNKFVQGALAIVALIFVGGLTYYLIETAPPEVVFAAVMTGNITEDVTATGIVTPVQNPTLSFEQGGQVASVNATVGEKVAAGTVLASLDTSVLQAQLEAAQAKLNEMEAPPRTVDVAGQQTGVATAQQSLDNTLATALAQAEQAVYTGADPSFDFSTRANPSLVFDTTDNTEKVTVDTERASLTSEFTSWQGEISTLNTESPTSVQSATTDSLTHLNSVRNFLEDMITALNNAQTGPSYSQTAQTIAIASVNQGLSTVNGLISSLTSEQLAVQAAQDQLNQTLAGATPQDIEAQQATVAGIEAQIHELEVVVPFAGTVASVSVKQGDTVTTDTEAISLIPQGNFEVDVYLAENDVTKAKVGDLVDITLDAYGAGRIFPATVSTIDTSPTTDPNDPNSAGYKVTLVFANADPAIANGMHANATIHAGSAQNVLLIPASAVITNGTQTSVLKQTSGGLVNTPITVGLSNDTKVQVLSGLSAGDSVSAVGSQS